MKGEVCLNCGVARKSVYTTYKGYVSSYIQVPCVKIREKCNDKYCMVCNLDGGHIVEYHGTGRHKWK